MPVVDVPVRGQHRHRAQPVLRDYLLDSGLRVLARVDDQAILARSRRDDVTISGERARGKSLDQHEHS